MEFAPLVELPILHIKAVPGTTAMESFTKHLLGAGLVAREAAG